MAATGINIAEMVNKSKGDYAYTLLDLDSAVTADAVEKIKAVDGVIKVRIVK
jgi:D-3-phosphoglycerate dehydrogenase